MRRTLLVSTAVLVATLTLAGCTAGMSGASDSGVAVDQSEVAPAQEGAAQEGAAPGNAVDGFSTGVAVEAREVIITGDVTITADDPIAASRDAVRIVETAGGRVDGRTEYAPSEIDGSTDAGSATLQLRIPADQLTTVLDQLEKLGRADEVALSTSDVTITSQDLDARISALQASVARISALVAQATSIDDLIRLETEVSTRQAELESLQAQQRYLADQVAMSTVNLYLRSEAQAPAVDPGDFSSGLATGWAAFVGFWAGLLVVLGVLLPWIVTLGIVAAVIVLLLRRRRAAQAESRVERESAPAPAQADEPISASSATP